MVTEHEKLRDHEKFRELGALANTGILTPNEWTELKNHLRICKQCCEVHQQYLCLAEEGMPLLAASYNHPPEQRSWDDTAAYQNLSVRIEAAEEAASFEPAGGLYIHLRRMLANPLAQPALAACLVVAIGFGSYLVANRAQTAVKQSQAYAEGRLQGLVHEKTESVDESLDAKQNQLSHLRDESLRMNPELTELRSVLRRGEYRARQLAAANNSMNEQLRNITQERDALSGQLRDAEAAYQSVQTELTNLRLERDKALLQSTSLEARIDELSAAMQDQDRRVRDDEKYLASDRDIRELIGARDLYIADVFDVDSHSRTRKPFGRVFYTRGKSLVFYAYDLDRQPDLKKAMAFQAWGRSTTDGGKPLNLGIFYMDSESNRRWVLRFDDPEQLAEIDTVFVTVEPHGGSAEPTGKPLLYASLRKEANHP
jgi:hypothetical protein